jgi:hypothetical protein
MKTFAVAFPIKLAVNFAPSSSLHEQVCPVAHCAAKPAVPPEHAPFVKVAGVEVNVPEIEPLMVKNCSQGGRRAPRSVANPHSAPLPTIRRPPNQLTPEPQLQSISSLLFFEI